MYEYSMSPSLISLIDQGVMGWMQDWENGKWEVRSYIIWSDGVWSINEKSTSVRDICLLSSSLLVTSRLKVLHARTLVVLSFLASFKVDFASGSIVFVLRFDPLHQ